MDNATITDTVRETQDCPGERRFKCSGPPVIKGLCQRCYHRAYMRRYKQTEKARIVNRRAQARYERQNPAIISAHHKVYRAIKAGKLSRPDVCGRCGESGRIEASHDDYDQPLVVEWLCRLCHMKKDGLL